MTDKMLAAFAAARRTGSFSTAAWELSATQQSISYSIKKLEEELGFPLFVRRASRVELTAGGDTFYAWYRALDAAAEHLAAGGGEALPSGSVTDVQIRCFLAAARTGSVAAAAEELYYAPQTVADHLAALEKALGERLFSPEGGRELTLRGQAWRQLFENAADSLASVRRYARERYQAGLDSAVLGLSEWIREGPLTEALRDFQGEVRTRVLSNPDLLKALETGDVDVALWSEGHAPVNLGLETTTLGAEELCLLTPADGRPAPLLLCPGWPRSYIENRAIATQEMRFGGYRPAGVRQVESLDRMRQLLETGEYAAVIERRFGSLIAAEDLRVIPLEVKSSLVACRRSNAGDCCAARLVAHLCEELT